MGTPWRRWLEAGGGVEGAFAVFLRDALDLYLFCEDGAFQAVGENFDDVAGFGEIGVISEQAHGLGLIAVYADVHLDYRLLSFGLGLFHDN
jgi:hypothetical protein